MKNCTLFFIHRLQRLKKFSREKIAQKVAFFYGFNFQFIAFASILKIMQMIHNQYIAFQLFANI